VLLLSSKQGWRLPRVEVDGYAENDLRPAARALEELLEAPVTILRYADRAPDNTRRVLEVVYVLESPELGETPLPGAAWVGREALAELPLAAPNQRDVAVTGRIEQIRAWCLSCLLRVPTADGAVFFKATAGSPLFVDEGEVMLGLARFFPANVPTPLAVESTRRWMLLDDFGPELGWNAPLEVREAVLRLFAHMQIESSGRVGELLALGCVDRRLEWLAAQTRELLADDAALAGLDDGEVATLRALGPKLEAVCLGLAATAIPDALVHGDLHLSNVTLVDGHYVFFDWTDAGVTHPFFDLIDVFRERDDSVREQLRGAYLSMWLDYEPMDRLLDIWKDAESVAMLHHAVSYRHILANVEPGAGRELEWALPYFLRKVLASSGSQETSTT